MSILLFCFLLSLQAILNAATSPDSPRVTVTSEQRPFEHIQFHAHCMTGNLEKVLETLKQHEGNKIALKNLVNTQGEKNGNSPLHAAAKRGFTHIIEALLNAGANINILNKQNETPLHVAVAEGEMETVLFLLQNDADISIKNIHGLTAGQIAEEAAARGELGAFLPMATLLQ